MSDRTDVPFDESALEYQDELWRRFLQQLHGLARPENGRVVTAADLHRVAMGAFHVSHIWMDVNWLRPYPVEIPDENQRARGLEPANTGMPL